MGLHEVPICFNCGERVPAADAVFAAPCDHDDCPSVVMHGLCLMDWRENRENAAQRMRVVVMDLSEVVGIFFEGDDDE